ncbi:SDR family NAD(P)-dependent oxidoreductase [Chryseolinea sp. T2]|uniref:SDR family NAD(P)-dependent oxidoreductase n=1 Tax=Chryseolinea sp. T2 TaxID=3129255 RepID=UPI0030775DD6
MNTKETFALVTGGATGIGRDIATMLAEEGYHLIITGQSSESLAAVAAAIKSRFSVIVHTYETDLSDSDDAFILHRDIKNQGIQIAVVVHSVHGQSRFEEFARAGIDKQHEVIHCNVMNVVVLSRLFLPEMISRNHGVLISAIADKQMDDDLNAVYIASIAFLDSFMSSLKSELLGCGVSVRNIRSGTMKDISFSTKGEFHTKSKVKASLTQIHHDRDGYESFMRDDK